MLSSTFALLSTALLGTVVSVAAWNPQITLPIAGDIWRAGANATVKWNVTAIPYDVNGTGTLYFGYDYNNSQNLHLAHPLAAHIDFKAGSVNVVVPLTPNNNPHAIVVLTGVNVNSVALGVSPKFHHGPANGK